jgi:hypothetical protein
MQTRHDLIVPTFCNTLQPPFVGNREKVQQKIVKEKLKLPSFLTSEAHSLLKGVSFQTCLLSLGMEVTMKRLYYYATTAREHAKVPICKLMEIFMLYITRKGIINMLLSKNLLRF